MYVVIVSIHGVLTHRAAGRIPASCFIFLEDRGVCVKIIVLIVKLISLRNVTLICKRCDRRQWMSNLVFHSFVSLQHLDCYLADACNVLQ